MGKSYLFGEPTTDRKKAFPDLKSLDIAITQEDMGFGRASDLRKNHHFNEKDFPASVQCSNPLCKQGGLELSNIVRFYESGEHDFPCNGHEGSPAGRKIGPRCHVTFKVKLTIERHPKQQS